MKITKTTTNRGFSELNFTDQLGVKCSIQKSSTACDGGAIWFGVSEADPQILASEIMEGGTGWVKYPIPESVLLTTRMHLDRDQVKLLIPILQKFVKTGEID